MIGSSLAAVHIPAYRGNYSAGREGRVVRKITLHHMAARWTAARCGQSFQVVGRAGSSHYGIGYDGEIAQYVGEEDTAWTDGSWISNLESVTIECADKESRAPWDVTDETFESLVCLCADIARRCGTGPLVKGQNLTWHSMYQPTVCPGEGLLSKTDLLCARVNALLAGEESGPIAVSYQAYAAGRWLPNVTGCDTGDAKNGYAGIPGRPVSGLFAAASAGNLYYRVHVMGGAWLPEVKNREDYAGVLGKPIDAVMIRSDRAELSYRVHTVSGAWLPAVSGYSETDAGNGYAGVFGKPIDAFCLAAEKAKRPALAEDSAQPVKADPSAEKETETRALAFLQKVRDLWREFFG